MTAAVCALPHEMSEAISPSAIGLSSLSIESEIINPFADETWDRLLCSFPGATIFHSSAWLGVLKATYNHQAFCLHFFRGKETLALVPLLEVRSALTGRRGVSLPFSDFCPALISSDSAISAVEETIKNLARTRKWKYFELRGENRLFRNAPATTEFFAHKLDLRPSPNELFEGCSSSARRAVRKAESCGLRTAVLQTEEGVTKYYALHCRTRKRLGIPPQSIAFFRNIHEAIFARDLGFAVIAEHESKPVAGAIFFQFGKQGLYKFGASDDAAQELRGNNLVMWQGIQEFAARGADSLHFGRTSTTNEGLRRFKLSWGTKEEPLKYFRLDPASEKPLSAPDRAAGTHNKIFRKLPLALNKLVGTLIYPHLD